MQEEKAEFGQLQNLLSKVGEGLDQYLKFEHPDALSSNQNWHKILEEPLPLDGVGIDQVTQQLVDVIIPNGSAIPNPGFSGYITTGATTVSALASTAASIASPQRYMVTAFNYLEELTLQWLAQMFGLGSMEGVYSSGGSVANLIALGGARQHAFEKIGIDPGLEGVSKPVRVYASEECHHTIQRSCGVLGVGRNSVQSIPVDRNGRMQADQLKQCIKEDIANGILPMAVVGNAGTTNTGAIDPLQEIGSIARKYGIWFHVDGAYGLPGILDDRIKHLYQGLELADSVIIDPHKWLGASVGVAATFVKDREILKRAFTQEPATYLEGSVGSGDNTDPEIEHSIDSFGIPYFEYGVELSAPCRGIVVWAMLKEIGSQGMKQRIIRHNDMASLLASIVKKHPNLELLNEPTLSICCFRYISPEIENLDQFNRNLHRILVRQNKYMPTTTEVNGKLAIRPCFIGARHEIDQIEGLVASIIKIGQELAQ